MRNWMNVPRAAAATVVMTLVGMTGCAADPVQLLTGTGTPTTPLTAGGATVVYAVQQPSSTSSSLQQYSLSASSSNASPTATITPPPGVVFNSVATDSAGNIYVGSIVSLTGQGEVLVYTAGSSGAAVPARIIYGGLSNDTTTFNIPYSMAINAVGSLAILTFNGNGNAIVTVPASTNGTPTPTAQLFGASTQMLSPASLAIDATGKIYVSDVSATNLGAVLEYSAGASGNTAPVATITTGTLYPIGISVDGSGNIYTVLDSPTQSGAGSLVEYAAGASGAATPTATISGRSTSVYFGLGVKTDSVGNVYLLNLNSSSTAFDFLGFKGGLTGNVSPGLFIVASLALNNTPGEIAIH